MFKKIMPYIFLIVFTYNTMGYFIIYKILTWDVKAQIEQILLKKVNLAECEVISIKKEKLSEYLHDDGKELKINNCFFDIVKSVENENEITFYCLNDKEEQRLYDAYITHAKNHNSDDLPNKSSKPAKKAMGGLVKIIFAQKTFTIPSFYPETFSYNSSKDNFNSIQIKKLLQPPKIA